MAIHFLNGGRKKYMVLLPIAFLLLNSLYFQFATKKINDTMLQEKLIAVTDAVNMVAEAVDANTSRKPYDHEQNIRGSVEFLDGLYQIYCAAYKPVDGGLEVVTGRQFETSIFEPMDYPEFVQAIREKESGNVVIGYTPEDQAYRELHLYFRWMPLYSPVEERYLMVAGVSEHSIIVQIPVWVSAGQWVSMVVTFSLNLWLILMIAWAGGIVELCEGDKRRGRG